MLTIIAAVANNGALGKDNDLIWHLPADLKRFKKITLGHYLIMGRKTFESLPGALPNRTTIVISRNKDYKAEGCLVTQSLEEAVELAKKHDENPYILGGGEIYKQAMKYADFLDLTHVHQDFEADTFFPEIDLSLWEEVQREDHPADEKHRYPYSFVLYKKK